jgi:hypothetical protein
MATVPFSAMDRQDQVWAGSGGRRDGCDGGMMYPKQLLDQAFAKRSGTGIDRSCSATFIPQKLPKSIIESGARNVTH